MLGELESDHVLQVRTDLGCHKRTCRYKEIHTEHWFTPLQIPVGMLQLVLIQIREQAPVVIEYRTHADRLHCFGVEHNAEIAVMTVRIENQRVKNTHAVEIIATSKLLKVFKQHGYGTLPLENACSLGKTMTFRCKQTALTNKLTSVEIQIIIYKSGTKNGCKLRGQELRQRLNLIAAAASLVKVDVLPFSDPALGIVAIGAKLRRSRG